jgi:hypothetical protein
MGMDSKTMGNDPRFYIPDQFVLSNAPLPHNLEEFIPKEYLPDVLLVHDPRGVTEGVEKLPSDGNVQFTDVPTRYERKLPEPMTGG